MENKSEKLKDPPGFLKDFLPFISPTIFDIINIPELSIKFSKMGFSFLFNQGVNERSKILGQNLPENLVLLTEDSIFSQDSKLTKKELGESVLKLFFTQIFKGSSVFLDLRKERFETSESGEVIFEPNGLWFDFSLSFIEGLREVYRGFYIENESEFYSGLEKVGLIDSSDSNEIKSKMVNLFKNHFGEALTHPVSFDMNHFKSSFHEVFSFVFEQKKELPTEFTFLGLYLVTLYLNLSELNESYDVRGCCLSVIK